MSHWVGESASALMSIVSNNSALCVVKLLEYPVVVITTTSLCNVDFFLFNGFSIDYALFHSFTILY